MAFHLRYIALHHFGGTGADPSSSTKHHSIDDINATHRARWPDFPSALLLPNGKPNYIGYTGIIWPDGSFTQTRPIGAETAAVYGFNKEAMSWCMAGNFTRIRGGDVPIDHATVAQRATFARICRAAIENHLSDLGLVIVPGTVLDFSLYRIYPHRFFQRTECYGSAYPDSFARDIVTASFSEQLNVLHTLLLSLLLLLNDRKERRVVVGRKVGGGDRSCCGYIL